MTFDEAWTLLGLAAGIVLMLIVVSIFHTLHNTFSISASLFVALAICWTAWWLWKNRLRNAKKGHIGIVIFIHISDRKLWTPLYEDFIVPLQAALSRELSASKVDILVAPLHITFRHQDPATANWIIRKKNAKCVVFGKVRAREDKYTVDLTCSVSHPELETESQSKFQRDISDGWISRLNIESEHHIIEKLELSSSLISLCAKYVLALTLCASQKQSEAEPLLAAIRLSLGRKKVSDIPPILKIRKNSDRILNNIYFDRASHYLRQWHESKDAGQIGIMEATIDKAFGAYRRNGSFLTLKSIACIILRSDFRQAKNNLNKISTNHRDVVWHLNYGFVLACESNETGVLYHYDRAQKIADATDLEVNLALLSELEEFIEWYRSEVQDLALLSFMLSFLNSNFKGDAIKANADYQKFLDHPEANLFPKALSRLSHDDLVHTGNSDSHTSKIRNSFESA